MEENNVIHMVMSPPDAMFIAWSMEMAADHFDMMIHHWKPENEESNEQLMRLMCMRFTAKKIQYGIEKLLIDPEALNSRMKNDPTSDEIAQSMEVGE